VKYVPHPRKQSRHPQTTILHQKHVFLTPVFATLTNFAPRNPVYLPLLQKQPGYTPSLPKTELRPLATPNSSLPTIPFTICTYKKLACNPCRICTSKTKNLKPRRINTYEKHRGVGVILLTGYPTKGICPERPSGAKGLSPLQSTSHESPVTSFRPPPFSYTIPPRHPRRPHEL
jgi:hypothetical protein